MESSCRKHSRFQGFEFKSKSGKPFWMKFSYQRNWFEVVRDVLGRIFRDGWCDFIVFLDAFILVIASFFATPALEKVWSLSQYLLFCLILQLIRFVITFFYKRETKVCIYCSWLVPGIATLCVPYPTGYLFAEAIHKVRLKAPDGCCVSLKSPSRVRGSWWEGRKRKDK